MGEESTLIYLVAGAVILIALAIVVIKLVKKILVNSVLGVIALLAVNYFGASLGVKIPLTIVTFLICAVLGLAGVGLLIIAQLLGFKIQ
ncbi:pro-sigmaK processing inhibitor BofA family protein [Candidatus Micrarchaeota archaeon]|nr:pro-sigmaK processing inhibitor BofA family protein [Candidatus Micrarchaeota archaeon]